MGKAATPIALISATIFFISALYTNGHLDGLVDTIRQSPSFRHAHARPRAVNATQGRQDERVPVAVDVDADIGTRGDEGNVDDEKKGENVATEAERVDVNGGEMRMKERCIIYDRPPRTGSTTIGSSLRKCLAPKGYAQGRGGAERGMFVRNMLETDSRLGAVLTRHMYMKQDDVDMIRAQCQKVLYVTSTARMKDRLWSAAKYKLRGGNGNVTVSGEKMRAKVVANLKKDTRNVAFLESYPWLGEGEKEMLVADKLEVDYVVRKERMAEDLGRLLQAFGCGGKFESENMHVASFEGGDVWDGVYVGEDETYKRLCERAKGNDEGLRKARLFA